VPGTQLAYIDAMMKLQTLRSNAQRTSGCGSRLLTAVVGGAAVLVFSLSTPAVAGQGSLRVAAGRDSRVVLDGKELSEQNIGGITENSAKCGKCHDACENGRSHAGLLQIDEQGGAKLPLDAEGRTTCITCHDSRRHAMPVASGDHLRISNLRRELCLACHRQETEDGPRIEIVAPLERAVVREEHQAFIGKASGLSGSDLMVRLNGSEFHLEVRDGEFSTWLRLQAGVNRIEVSSQDRLVWKGEVFYGESSLDNYKLASSGHRTGNRAQCLECHLKMDELRSGVTSAAPALCYGCHDRIDEKRYVHGPLAVGDCLACHDPHGGYGTAHLRQERALLCGNCHDDRRKVATVVCNAAGKECVDCHDPHQSDMRYLLKGPQYTMR